MLWIGFYLIAVTLVWTGKVYGKIFGSINIYIDGFWRICAIIGLLALPIITIAFAVINLIK